MIQFVISCFTTPYFQMTLLQFIGATATVAVIFTLVLGIGKLIDVLINKT